MKVLADEGADSVRHHAARRRGHFRDVALALCFGVGDILERLRDVGGLVADALHVGNHLQRRGDDPQIAGHGLLLQEELHAQALDVPLLVVDADLQGVDIGGLDRPPLGQRPGHQADGLLAESAHSNELHVELAQLLIESRPHYPNLPVM